MADQQPYPSDLQVPETEASATGPWPHLHLHELELTVAVRFFATSQRFTRQRWLRNNHECCKSESYCWSEPRGRRVLQ